MYRVYRIEHENKKWGSEACFMFVVSEQKYKHYFCMKRYNY